MARLPFTKKLTTDERAQREAVRAGKAAALGFLLGWVIASVARDRSDEPYRAEPPEPRPPASRTPASESVQARLQRLQRLLGRTRHHAGVQPPGRW